MNKFKFDDPVIVNSNSLGIKVKPLVWEEGDYPDEYYSDFEFGEFIICKSKLSDHWTLTRLNSIGVLKFKDIEKAKQAANDYVHDIIMRLIEGNE